MTFSRQTKYCQAIQSALNSVGHATNNELLNILRKDYPLLSATTVHRATARLAQRGLIGIAPTDTFGSMRYDGNVDSHDHFLCSQCGILKDADIKTQVTPIIEASIDGCSISGRLTVSGICKKCMRRDSR